MTSKTEQVLEAIKALLQAAPIHHAPGPMLAVLPTVEMAKRNSKQRIDPLIEEGAALRKLVTLNPEIMLRRF